MLTNIIIKIEQVYKKVFILSVSRGVMANEQDQQTIVSEVNSNLVPHKYDLVLN